jgi:hypothetical protein
MPHEYVLRASLRTRGVKRIKPEIPEEAPPFMAASKQEFPGFNQFRFT